MTYAEDREYSPGQRRLVVYEHLRDIGPLTVELVARLAGCKVRCAYKILYDIEGVVRLGKDGKWYRYLGPHSTEDDVWYGR